MLDFRIVSEIFSFYCQLKMVFPFYETSGIVVHGRRIGKLIGLPTANLKVEMDTDLPEPAVYISKVFLKEKTLYGITHIGARSTVDDSQEISFETHFEFIIRNIRTQNESTVVFHNPDSTKIRRIILSYRADQKRLFDRTEILGNKTACFRFFIDIRKHQVKLCNHKIILSAKEFDVLYLSYSNLDVAFMIKQIYEVVWHDSANGIYHAVKNTVF